MIARSVGVTLRGIPSLSPCARPLECARCVEYRCSDPLDSDQGKRLTAADSSKAGAKFRNIHIDRCKKVKLHVTIWQCSLRIDCEGNAISASRNPMLFFERIDRENWRLLRRRSTIANPAHIWRSRFRFDVSSKNLAQGCAEAWGRLWGASNEANSSGRWRCCCPPWVWADSRLRRRFRRQRKRRFLDRAFDRQSGSWLPD